MRLSSIVSLVVVTASFALAGCAADGEFANETQNEPNVIHSDQNGKRGLTQDINQNGKISDLYESDKLETTATDHYAGEEPRIDSKSDTADAIDKDVKITPTPSVSPVWHH